MKAFRWLVINSLLAACMWFGFFGDVEGARNIVQFWTWMAFGLSLMTFSDDIAKAMAKSGPSVPRWINALADIAGVCVLVWFGWWWTGAAWALGALLVYGNRERGKDLAAQGATA